MFQIDSSKTGTADVSWSVQSLQEKFATLQTRAVAWRLDGVKTSDSTRSEDAIRLFMESTCHSCLIAEITDVTTCEGAYAVNLLDMGMSVWEKMIDNQMAVTIKKRDTVTFDHSGCDRVGCCQVFRYYFKAR